MYTLRSSALLSLLFSAAASAQGVEQLESISNQRWVGIFDVSAPANGQSLMRATGSAQRQISDNGRYVVFESAATNLVPGVIDENGINDVFLHDRETGQTEYVSLTFAGTPAGGSEPTMDGSGRIIVYVSQTNPATGSYPEFANVYVRNLGAVAPLTSKAILVSRPIEGFSINEHSFHPSITPEGEFIAYASRATTLVNRDLNGVSDVFFAQFHPSAGTVDSSIAISTNNDLQPANGHSDSPSIARDIQSPSWERVLVAYRSDATNLVNDAVPNLGSNIYLRTSDRFGSGVVRLIDVPIGAPQGGVYGSSSPTLYHSPPPFRILVAFSSSYSNLVPIDGNGTTDVFVKTVMYPGRAPSILRVENSALGAANNESTFPIFSGDGRKLAFSSSASNLVLGDTNGRHDVFLLNLDDAQPAFLIQSSLAANGIQGTGHSTRPSLSYDGSFVVFQSNSDNWAISRGVSAAGLSDIFVATVAMPLFRDGFEN